MDARRVELSGRVARESVGGSSKSARVAVVLKAEDGETYVLRRQGGPAFDDEALEPLVGDVLDISGVLTGDTLIMREWRRR